MIRGVELEATTHFNDRHWLALYSLIPGAVEAMNQQSGVTTTRLPLAEQERQAWDGLCVILPGTEAASMSQDPGWQHDGRIRLDTAELAPIIMWAGTVVQERPVVKAAIKKQKGRGFGELLAEVSAEMADVDAAPEVEFATGAEQQEIEQGNSLNMSREDFEAIQREEQALIEAATQKERRRQMLLKELEALED